MTSLERFFAVIPAAGTGTRLGAAIPKQYLEIGGRTILEWSVSTLLAADWIEQVVVVVAREDQRASALLRALPGDRQARVQIVPRGGQTRRDTVLAGLDVLNAVGDDDWALVHDAARPGLSLDSLNTLRAELSGDPVGGLLALPVADTVKRSGPDERVSETVPREGLWLAQTPQMFRYRLLREALRASTQVTDEAAAIEAAGFEPRLIVGERSNFKITTREDLMAMAGALAYRPQSGET
jgi:2-C-methyl-D-erythritol 4-phosphate cytidylyltransferase